MVGLLVLVFPSVVLLSDTDRPRLSLSGNDDTAGDRSPKKVLGDHGDFSALLGETERAGLLFATNDGEVLRRGKAMVVGVGGGWRGAMNLSAGFIVLTSPFAIELIEALR
jgi:hypothetical protein